MRKFANQMYKCSYMCKAQRIRIGRQRLRWEDDVRVDLRKVKIQNWSKVTGQRSMEENCWAGLNSQRVVAQRKEVAVC